MNEPNRTSAYLRLHPSAALKRLENSYLYHIQRDELYEIDKKAENFLSKCDGSSKGMDLTSDDEFVQYCIDEGLIETLSHPDKIKIDIGIAPHPSLRYLELQLLDKCNLKCRHCYLGPPSRKIMQLHDALKIAGEFSAMGGLRLLISGGEPMLYPHLKEFIEETSNLRLRRVLLTNGTKINRETVSWLNAEEIQFSLDGWERGHNILRGDNTFIQTYNGIMAAKEADIPVSIATMIHRENLDEFEKLGSFIKDIEAIEWGIDILCMAGSLKNNRDLAVPYKEAAPFMKSAFGGGYHGSSEGFACGRHLLTVLPDGNAVKCGFYENRHLGDARKSLSDAWLKLKHIKLNDLFCRDCPAVNECAGGCRFRAGNDLSPDRAMCAFFGINPDLFIKES